MTDDGENTTVSDGGAEEWEQVFYYEYRIVSTVNDVIEREFRCPVCHRPLRVGKTNAEATDPDEIAPEEWRPINDIEVGGKALMCARPECRAYFKLTE